jgi:hypothetical protein
LYLLLRKITNIAFKSSLSLHDPKYFSQLVDEHHKIKIKLFGRLKYKDHVATHYEKVMVKSGPLNQFSNMRFEGKHDSYKKTLHATHNHKNLLHTLCVKSQIQISHFLLNFDFSDEDSHQKKYKRETMNSNIPHVTESDKILESVVVLGKKIKKDSVFEKFDENDHMYHLGKIVVIFERDRKILIVYKLLTNVKTCESLDCYKFQGEASEFCLQKLSDICDISRTSYVYSSLHGNFVNLSIQ